MLQRAIAAGEDWRGGPFRPEPLVVQGLAGRGSRGVLGLTVDPGTCVAISGPSGSGKSTLLRLIADLDPGIGTARIGAMEREAVPASRWRRQVVYVASDAGWWTTPVSAHMPDLPAARSLLAELGMPEALLEASPDDVSSGERQRLSLVRALVLRPRFLLLDEPTSALDQAAILLVEEMLQRFKRGGMGMLVVSHDSAQIARMADRHYVLSAGGLTELAA